MKIFCCIVVYSYYQLKRSSFGSVGTILFHMLYAWSARNIINTPESSYVSLYKVLILYFIIGLEAVSIIWISVDWDQGLWIRETPFLMHYTLRLNVDRYVSLHMKCTRNSGGYHKLASETTLPIEYHTLSFSHLKTSCVRSQSTGTPQG
jgi:hypothetical protein